MSALQRRGRRAEALAVFDRARRQLADDLGVAPGELLRRARWSILRGDDAGPGRGRAGVA
jgi:DNA-binding SARP family transcriptional activator